MKLLTKPRKKEKVYNKATKIIYYSNLLDTNVKSH